MNLLKSGIAGAIVALLTAGSASAASTTSTDFSSGLQGWLGNGAIDSTLGNSAPAYHTQFEYYGAIWQNSTNQAFLCDYTATSSVTLGIDVLTQSIQFDNSEVSGDLVVKLVDKGDPAAGTQDAVLWYDLGEISAAKGGWQHFGVTFGTSGSTLPSGWGADDGEGDLSLPAGRTFADVLANIDQIEFTTLKPGGAYDFATFDVSVDNISLTTSAVPEPASAFAMLLGMGVLAARRRRLAA